MYTRSGALASQSVLSFFASSTTSIQVEPLKPLKARQARLKWPLAAAPGRQRHTTEAGAVAACNWQQPYRGDVGCSGTGRR